MGDRIAEQIAEKAKPSPGTELIDVSYETIVLAFDLVNKEVPNAPDRIMQILQGVSIKKEIENALTDYAKQLVQANNQSKVLNAKDAGNMALDALKNEGKKLGGVVLKQYAEAVKGTKEFEQLQELLHNAGKEFKDQPIGVWFTDSKVYIIASGLILSAGAAVFATYYGSKKLGPARVFGAIEGKPIKVRVLGQIDLSAQLAKFDKNAKTADFKLSGTKDWKQVKFNLEVVGHASLKDSVRVEGIGVNASLAVQVNQNVQVAVKGGLDRPNFDFHSTVADIEAIIKVKPGQDQPFQFYAGAGFKGTLGKKGEGTVTFGVEIPLGKEGSAYDRLMKNDR